MMENSQCQLKGKPHRLEKFQGAAISVENAITNSVHTSKFETSCVRVRTVLEEPGEVHAQEAAECHQEEGNLTKYQLEVFTHYGTNKE